MNTEDFNKTEESFKRYKENLTSLSQEFELSLFLYLLNKIKWIILSIIILFTFGGILYLRYTPKIYQTSALIQVSVKEQPNGFSDLYSFSINANLNSEIAIMKSQKAIERVIKGLNLKVFYFFEGEVLTRFLYDQSPFTFENFSFKDKSILSKPIYLSFDGTYFSLTNKNEDLIYANYILANKFFSSKYLSGKLSFSNQNWKELISSMSTNERLFFKIPSNKEITQSILSNLSISIENQSAHSIRIIHKHTNPHFSKDICNSVVKIYMNHEINKKQKSTDKIVKFIAVQKDSVRKRLIKSEKDLRIFKKNNKINQNLLSITGFKEKAEDIEKEIVKLQLDIDLLTQFNNMFENNLSTEINTSSVKNISLLTSIFYNESLTSKMIEQLQEDVMERDNLLKDITPNNKSIILLNGEIEESILYIKKAVKLLKKSYKEKYLKLERKITYVDTEFSVIPEKELELIRLQQVKEINNKYYMELLNREIEYELSKAGITTYNEILQNAPLNETPISPNEIIVYSLFIGISLVISIIIVLINYLLHDKITAIHEINKYSKIEISALGMIPFVKNKMDVSQLIVDKSPKSMLTESFRAIRTNLQFINNDEKSKIIAVSSTISGEGKTFVAINLGGIIAFTGKKVVVIDLDMRKPKIHLALETTNQKGMSEILSKKNTIEDCIKRSSLNNLDFITAGTLPPNPSELIVSEVFDQTLEKLKKIYDIIIIDNPPVGLVTDGIPVLQKADYPIYIFKANYSRKNFVQNVEKLIRENNLKKLSVVLNAVDSKRNEYSNKYGYGYGSGYGYGYGYGYGSDSSYYIEKESKKEKSIFAKIKSYFKS